MTAKSAAPLPALALGLLSIVWGYNWVVTKVALAYCGPITFATLRFVIAPLCLIPLMIRLRVPLVPSRRHALICLMLGIALAANFAATFIAVKLGGAGKTAVLVYTMPFWVLVFARATLEERLTRMQNAAVLCALIGLCVLISPWQRSGQMLPSALAVAAGMAWAITVVYVKHLQRKEPVSMMLLSLWQMIVAAAALILSTHTVVEEGPIIWNSALIAAVLFTGVIATGLGWMLFYFALRRLSAGMTGLGTLATPVIGVLAAWLQLGEIPSVLEAHGMMLIGLGLALLAWDGLRGSAGLRAKARA